MTPNINCPVCGHDIDGHGYDAVWSDFTCSKADCGCELDPSDVTQRLLDAGPTEREVEQVTLALEGLRVNGSPLVTFGARQIAEHLLRVAVEARP